MQWKRAAAFLLAACVLTTAIPTAFAATAKPPVAASRATPKASTKPATTKKPTASKPPVVASLSTPKASSTAKATSTGTGTLKPTATPKPTAVPTVKNAKPNSSPAPHSSSRPESLSADQLYAAAACLLDAATGEVLFSKNPDERMNPASTTKLLTAIVALENAHPDDIVTVKKEATQVEETTIKLKTDERIPLRDLLYGMLLKSGNDAALAIAYHVSGSVKEFAKLMNAKAAELGCASSSFVNPHGLTATGHFTTAHDLALIAQAAMKKPEIRQIVATYSYTIAATNKSTPRELENSNVLLPDSGKQYSYEYSIGGKTGYTSAAQHTYVGIARKDSVELIAVVMGSTKEGKWIDALNMLNFGFTRYQPINIRALYEASPHVCDIANVDPDDADQGKLALRLHNPDDPALTSLRDTAGNRERIESDFWRYARIEYTATALRAPIMEGAPLAQLIVTTDAGTVTATLVATRAVNEKPRPTVAPALVTLQAAAGEKSVMKSYGWILIIPATLLVLLVVFVFRDTRRRRRRRGNISTSHFSVAPLTIRRRR